MKIYRNEILHAQQRAEKELADTLSELRTAASRQDWQRVLELRAQARELMGRINALLTSPALGD